MYQILLDIPLTKDYFCLGAITDTLMGQVSVCDIKLLSRLLDE